MTTSLHVLQTASSGNVSVSSLQYEPKPEDTGKQLRCKAESPVISHAPLHDQFKIEVFCEYSNGIAGLT